MNYRVPEIEHPEDDRQGHAFLHLRSKGVGMGSLGGGFGIRSLTRFVLMVRLTP